jgi:FtsP/CotA-like multicopper oxidase with cupredoxin domain
VGAAVSRIPTQEICPRPLSGSVVPEPEDIRSQHGILKVDLVVRNARQGDGSVRYCYMLGNGSQAPTLRLRPGELLVVRLKNELTAFNSDLPQPAPARRANDTCHSGAMSLTATNLHFHGMTVPPICHQDEVLKTSIQPGDPPFEYRIRIPENAAPGLYWYHPHIHGFSKAQVLGGASGALIVEGIESVNPQLAGLAERVLIIRDQDLLNPSVPQAKSEPIVARMTVDRDGDSSNNGGGFGRPAKDLSVNFVPVPYPDYPSAVLRMRPLERQLWRLLNASAITYLDLWLQFDGTPQQLGIVAIDGVPLRGSDDPSKTILWRNHIGLPPGARAEFIVTGPPTGVPAVLVTRTVDTGRGGDNDPNRALALVVADANTPLPHSRLPPSTVPRSAAVLPWLGDVAPVRERRLYFSEKLSDPNNPGSPTEFSLSVDGHTPAPFDPTSNVPSIVAQQGTVEDWIIENRSTELHDFHIHQLHFLLLDWVGIPVTEPFLRDTVNVPFFIRGMRQNPPSVRLRMDFRDPNTVGTFVYHCHLLEHEDGGMMGIIRVDPAPEGVDAAD